MLRTLTFLPRISVLLVVCRSFDIALARIVLFLYGCVLFLRRIIVISSVVTVSAVTEFALITELLFLRLFCFFDILYLGTMFLCRIILILVSAVAAVTGISATLICAAFLLCGNILFFTVIRRLCFSTVHFAFISVFVGAVMILVFKFTLIF